MKNLRHKRRGQRVSGLCKSSSCKGFHWTFFLDSRFQNVDLSSEEGLKTPFNALCTHFRGLGVPPTISCQGLVYPLLLRLWLWSSISAAQYQGSCEVVL